MQRPSSPSPIPTSPLPSALRPPSPPPLTLQVGQRRRLLNRNAAAVAGRKHVWPALDLQRGLHQHGAAGPQRSTIAAATRRLQRGAQQCRGGAHPHALEHHVADQGAPRGGGQGGGARQAVAQTAPVTAEDTEGTRRVWFGLLQVEQGRQDSRLQPGAVGSPPPSHTDPTPTLTTTTTTTTHTHTHAPDALASQHLHAVPRQPL